MDSRWRWQFYLALFLTVFSVYLLIPTLFDFGRYREAAERQGAELPWYVRLFPDRQLNLGLDIQGGIYVELEVNLNEALVHRSEIIVGEIERFLREKGIAYKKAAVIPETDRIQIYLNSPESLTPLRQHLDQVYGTSLKEMENPP